VNGKGTCGRRNVQVEPGGAGHRLSGSKLTGDFGFESQQDRNQNPNNKEIKTQITKTPYP